MYTNIDINSENNTNITKYEYVQQLNIEIYSKENFSNTIEEQTVLEYIESFRRQFIQIFPSRQQSLFLCPKNEFGIRKFVCSSIRPSLQKFVQTWDYKQCSEFVSNYLKFVPLDAFEKEIKKEKITEEKVLISEENKTEIENEIETEEKTETKSETITDNILSQQSISISIQFPDLLVSPSVLQCIRNGDSLDFAIFLECLLTGSGYDAYIVCGIAPYFITQCNQSQNECPSYLLQNTKWIEINGNSTEIYSTEKPFEIPEYYNLSSIEERTNMDNLRYSEYLQIKENEIELEKKIAIEQLSDCERKELFDPLKDKRIHFWILVKKGLRNIQKSFFIEPSTAKIYQIFQSSNEEMHPYLRIESVFNNKNYWVNVQYDQEINGKKLKAIKDMSFTFEDNKCWEFVLFDDKHMVESVVVTEETNNSNTDGTDVPSMKEILQLPPSWCSFFRIKQQSIDAPFPNGYKIIDYYKCRVEKWHRFYSDQHGCILKVTLFSDDEKLVVNEIRQIFKDREDKLSQQVTKPMEKTILEKFEPGRISGLYIMIQISDEHRITYYYKNSRTDGLLKREEKFGEYVIEHFHGRSDFVSKRIIYCVNNKRKRNLLNFSLEEEENDDAMHDLQHKTVNVLFAGDPKLEYGVSIIEEFYDTPNTSTDNELSIENENEDSDEIHKNNIRQIRFSLIDGEYRLDYHFTQHSILAKYTIFNKDSGEVKGWQPDPLKCMPNALKIKKKFEQLVIKEKEVLTELRERERNFGLLLQKINKERLKIQLIKDPYIIADEYTMMSDNGSSVIAQAELHPKKNDCVQENDENIPQINTGERRFDLLSTYLPNYSSAGNRKNLNKEQIDQIKEDCLRALKERLVQRLNIITRRLHSEVTELEKHKSEFEREQQEIEFEDEDRRLAAEERFDAYKKECEFRIRIIKNRLSRHEKQAIQKMNKLNDILDTHPGLM